MAEGDNKEKGVPVAADYKRSVGAPTQDSLQQTIRGVTDFFQAFSEKSNGAFTCAFPWTGLRPDQLVVVSFSSPEKEASVEAAFQWKDGDRVPSSVAFFVDYHEADGEGGFRGGAARIASVPLTDDPQRDIGAIQTEIIRALKAHAWLEVKDTLDSMKQQPERGVKRTDQHLKL